MQLKHLKKIQYYLIAVIFLFLIVALSLLFSRTTKLSQSAINSVKKKLPPSAFTFSPEKYHAIGQTILALKFVPPTLNVPDLSQALIYYGRNTRPDADSHTVKLHFAFQGTKSTVAVEKNKKVYLIYDKNLTPHKYSFSPNNQPTSLGLPLNLMVMR